MPNLNQSILYTTKKFVQIKIVPKTLESERDNILQEFQIHAAKQRFKYFYLIIKKKTSIVNIYVNNFLLASNTIAILEALKKIFVKKYDVKDLGEVKTDIEQQISKDAVMKTIKIN